MHEHLKQLHVRARAQPAFPRVFEQRALALANTSVHSSRQRLVSFPCQPLSLGPGQERRNRSTCLIPPSTPPPPLLSSICALKERPSNENLGQTIIRYRKRVPLGQQHRPCWPQRALQRHRQRRSILGVGVFRQRLWPLFHRFQPSSCAAAA